MDTDRKQKRVIQKPLPKHQSVPDTPCILERRKDTWKTACRRLRVSERYHGINDITRVKKTEREHIPTGDEVPLLDKLGERANEWRIS